MNNEAKDSSGAIAKLQAAYGSPSQEAFGSAVFVEQLSAADGLEQAALEKYRYFIGDLWERYGEDAWMGPWKEVYERPNGADHAIVAELNGIGDQDAALSAPMILDVDPDALSAVFDAPVITDVRVYTLGDGAAMSGLLIAAWNSKVKEATLLVFLMD
jgi:hypothetical protein